MRIMSVFVLCASFVMAAPIPANKPKVKPPAVFSLSGTTWNVKWNGGDYHTHFAKDGSYTASGGWVGSWSFDPKTRTLHVSETCNNGATFIIWSATLDEALKGKGVIQGSNTSIDMALEQPKPQQLGPVL